MDKTILAIGGSMPGNMYSGGIAPTASAQPAKPWKDITVEDKLERQRAIIKDLLVQVEMLRNKLQNTQNMLTNHSHIKDIREPLIPLREAENIRARDDEIRAYGVSPLQEDDDVYF